MAVAYRFAAREDTGLILQFIRELADYEKMLDQVVADEELLARELFDKRHAEVLFTLVDGQEVGFALFFHNFSTFLGRSGIYLEDLYVRPEHRGKGLAAAALTRHYQRMGALGAEYMTGGGDPFYRRVGYTETVHWMHWKREAAQKE